VIEQRRTVIFEEIDGRIHLGQYTPDMFGLNNTVCAQEGFRRAEVAWEAHHGDGYLIRLDVAYFMRRVISIRWS